MAPFVFEPNNPHPDPFASNPLAPSHRLEPRDVALMLRLMAELSALRNDPRAWRLELLTALTALLPAAVAAAFILKISPSQKTPVVVGIFETGFKAQEEHAAFLHEVNTVPFQDPLSRHVLDSLAAAPANSIFPTRTAARFALFDDAAWNASPYVRQYRRPAGLEDCLLSAQRRPSTDPADAAETIMVIAAYKRRDDPARFSPRDHALVDILHVGLAWLYHAEESAHRLTRASDLSPRLRQTLDFLLAGDTERQVALKMNISAHTVHDYVKALYLHFGVSSRGELLAKWIQSGGQNPSNRDLP